MKGFSDTGVVMSVLVLVLGVIMLPNESGLALIFLLQWLKCAFSIITEYWAYGFCYLLYGRRCTLNELSCQDAITITEYMFGDLVATIKYIF